MADVQDDELRELLQEVRRIEVQSRRLVKEVMAGGYSSVFRGAGMEFQEVREYVVGDDPRAVDWNVTARVGRPFVKKFRDEREQTVLFLLDLSASMTGGFGLWSLRQMAARIAACLALSAQNNDDKVGLVAFAQDVEKYLPATKGLPHVLRIVRDCLALPAAGARTDLAPPLQFAAQLLRRRSTIFVLSDFLSPIPAKELRMCARKHDLIAVHLLPPELAGLRGGLCNLRDPETGRDVMVDWGHAPARAEYARRVAAWQGSVRAALRRAGVDRMDVPCPRDRDRDAVARPILQFFLMRELRGEKR